MKALTILVLATALMAASADNYAVLVAGSNGFYNYRHQADVCHAYQTLIKNGIPANNIVTLAYDDIAKDSSNPFPGKVFNKPTDKGTAGTDVYNGCVLDYTGEDVTPENFLAILEGNKKGVKGGNGRVLESGASDRVFINFADHGGTGLIAFPSSYLYADKLLKTLANMTTNKQYSELTFYLEACESGSMFENLPTNTKQYGVSAASPDESSWGTYCDPDDVVDGTHIGSCLGDLFSVNWMEDTDKADLKSETLQAQYEAVAKLTDKSKVMQWGDVSFTSEPIGNFVGGGAKYSTFLNKIENYFKSGVPASTKASSIDSRDVKLQYLVNKYKYDPSESNYAALMEELNKMKHFNKVFGAFKSQFNLTGTVEKTTNFDCYRNLINKFEATCGKPDESSIKNYRMFYEACQNHMGFGYEGFTGVFAENC